MSLGLGSPSRPSGRASESCREPRKAGGAWGSHLRVDTRPWWAAPRSQQPQEGPERQPFPPTMSASPGQPSLSGQGYSLRGQRQGPGVPRQGCSGCTGHHSGARACARSPDNWNPSCKPGPTCSESSLVPEGVPRRLWVPPHTQCVPVGPSSSSLLMSGPPMPPMQVCIFQNLV